MQDQSYKDKVLRNLFEAIWEYQNSIDKSTEDADKALGEVIFNATNFPSIVSGRIDELINKPL